MERENKIHNEILPTTKKADSKSKISDKEFFLKVSFFRTFFRTFFFKKQFLWPLSYLSSGYSKSILLTV